MSAGIFSREKKKNSHRAVLCTFEIISHHHSVTEHAIFIDTFFPPLKNFPVVKNLRFLRSCEQNCGWPMIFSNENDIP